MYYALATDYDGTIATEGCVDSETIAMLQRWRERGRRLILVTGRILEDWLTIFPQYGPVDLFDWVVAENGAVLYQPQQQQIKLLADPPPAEFVQRLQMEIGAGSLIASESSGNPASRGEFARLMQTGAAPLSIGRVIVATWQPYDQLVEQLIQAMNLNLQVILNKRAVMVLPQGVDKASGLKAVLAELKLTPGQTIGVGDAENDLHLLRFCGFSAAVANALPSVKAEVDWVATQSRGAGVAELIQQFLAESTLSP